LNVNTFLVALLTVLVNKDALDGVEVVSKIHPQARASLTAAGQESFKGLKEWSQIEMSGLLVGLLLLVDTTLLLKSGDCGIDLLLLLFASQSPLLSGGSSITAVLAPIGEVTRTSHVVLGETKDLEGLNEELLLGQSIANKVVVVGRVLVRQEVGRWLSQTILSQSLVQEVLDMLAI
jgi:hypothetical protein